MPTLDELYDQFETAHNAGDRETAAQLATQIFQMEGAQNEEQAPVSDSTAMPVATRGPAAAIPMAPSHSAPVPMIRSHSTPALPEQERLRQYASKVGGWPKTGMEFAGGVKHALMQLANLTGDPDASDALVKADTESLDRLAGNQFSLPRTLGAGAIEIPASAVLSPAGPLLGGAVGGAAGAGLFNDKPIGDRGFDVAAGTVMGGATGAAPAVIGAVAKNALPRANRMAYRLLHPTTSEAVSAELDFGSFERVGELLRQYKIVKPRMNLAQRRDALIKLGEAAGKDLDSIENIVEAAGGKVDKTGIVNKLYTEIDDIFGVPGKRNTRIFTAGRNAARDRAQGIWRDPDLRASSPVKNWEAQKQALQTEAHDRIVREFQGSPSLASQDPDVAFLRRAASTVRQGVEDAVDDTGRRIGTPELGDMFRNAKLRSRLSLDLAPKASRAVASEFSGSTPGGVPHAAYSPHALGINAAWEYLVDPLRPWLVPANVGLQKAYNMTPTGTGKSIPLIEEWLRRNTQSNEEYKP